MVDARKLIWKAEEYKIKLTGLSLKKAIHRPVTSVLRPSKNYYT